MKMKKLVGLGLGAAMVFSMPFGALAAGGDVNVQGNIKLSSPTPGPDDQFDVIIPTSVYWFVNNDTNPVIKNGTLSGGADSNVWGDGAAGTDYTVNKITSNTANDIGVAFMNFSQVNTNNNDAANIAPNLTLNMAWKDTDGDDLTVSILDGVNLSDGFVTFGAPIGRLAEGESFGFGFKGQFNGAITGSTNFNPEYTMTLGFAFVPSP